MQKSVAKIEAIFGFRFFFAGLVPWHCVQGTRWPLLVLRHYIQLLLARTSKEEWTELPPGNWTTDKLWYVCFWDSRGTTVCTLCCLKSLCFSCCVSSGKTWSRELQPECCGQWKSVRVTWRPTIWRNCAEVIFHGRRDSGKLFRSYFWLRFCSPSFLYVITMMQKSVAKIEAIFGFRFFFAGLVPWHCVQGTRWPLLVLRHYIQLLLAHTNKEEWTELPPGNWTTDKLWYVCFWDSRGTQCVPCAVWSLCVSPVA